MLYSKAELELNTTIYGRFQHSPHIDQNLSKIQYIISYPSILYLMSPLSSFYQALIYFWLQRWKLLPNTKLRPQLLWFPISTYHKNLLWCYRRFTAFLTIREVHFFFRGERNDGKNVCWKNACIHIRLIKSLLILS